MDSHIKKAMVFAAGLGTRLKPFTDNHPKALFKINGKTLLERNIEYLIKYGIDDIIINIHHFGDQIKEHVVKNNSWGIKICFSDETNELLDTGGGLIKAADFFYDTENFILYNADILTNLPLDEMMKFHFKYNPLVTLSVSERKSSRYFLFDKDNILCGWENVNTGEMKIRLIRDEYYSKAFSGIHIVNRKLLPTRMNAEKYSITDWYLDICAQQKIMGYNNNSSSFIDVGKISNLSVAEQLFV